MGLRIQRAAFCWVLVGAASCVLILFLAAFNHPQRATAQALPKPLRVFAYNTGGVDLSKWAPEERARQAKQEMGTLANFIIANQIDVALLSEISNMTNRKNSIPEDIDEGIYLQQLLASRGYQMQLWNAQFAGITPLFGQIILTRYSAVPNSFLYQRIDDSRSLPSVEIQSPLGRIRVLSVHTQYGSQTCNQLDFINNYMKTVLQSNSRMLAGGDFNNSACDNSWDDIEDDYQDFCRRNIDHIIAPKNNDFKQVACQTMDVGISDHFAVMADLLLKDGLAYPNPLPNILNPPPTATPTPPPTPIAGDLNGDRVVTAQDAALLVSRLNTQYCSYNLEGDCTLDLYDYNKLYSLVSRF